MRTRYVTLIVIAVLIVSTLACGQSNTGIQTDTEVPTKTPWPTLTPWPTKTPWPSPQPTWTQWPTRIEQAASTPLPTNTVTPTGTSLTLSDDELDDCILVGLALLSEDAINYVATCVSENLGTEAECQQVVKDTLLETVTQWCLEHTGSE